MKISHKHELSITEAIDRIDRLLDKLQEDHSGDISDTCRHWTASDKMKYSLTIGGFWKIQGTVTVFEKEVVVEGDVPLLALPFVPKIKKIIYEQMTNLLALGSGAPE